MIKSILRSIRAMKKRTDRSVLEIDLIRLMFQTRDCRGGKGEKTLFYIFFMTLYDSGMSPYLFDLLPLVAEYGYPKDYFLLLKMCDDTDGVDRTPLTDAIYDFLVKQFKLAVTISDKDVKNADDMKILGFMKWFPREGKSFRKYMKELTRRIHPKLMDTPQRIGYAYKLYRKTLVKCCKTLDLVETKMCADKFDKIDPSKVPSRAMKIYTKALLNEELKVTPSVYQYETGNRYPNDPGRVECRQKTLTAAIEGALNGKQLMVDELVRKVPCTSTLSAGVKLTIDAMAEAILTDVKSKIDTDESTLSQVLCLCDVSGSMGGIPMDVCIGLGILISQCSHESLRDMVLTFETEPKWHDLSKLSGFCDKVTSLRQAPWGGSTDFEKAMDRIIGIVRTRKLPIEAIPKYLLVFSDMQFDHARSQCYYGRGFGPQPTNSTTSWDTAYESIIGKFATLGRDMYGEEIDPPTIVFWNIRSGTIGHATQADTPGVVMLSGYSHALATSVLRGDFAPEITEMIRVDGTISKTETKITPTRALYKILSDERYEPVASLVERWYTKSSVTTTVSADPDDDM